MERFPKYRPAFKDLNTPDKILLCLMVGMMVPAFLTSPFGLYTLAGGLVRYTFKRADFHREIRRLEKRGYISLQKTPKGFFIRLLKKGKKRQSRAILKSLKLPRQTKWDRKWRLFIFDIPEKHRYERDYVRQKLKELGLYNIQRSVFAYPYDCRKELELVSDVLGIVQFTTYAEVSYSDIDKELREHFKKII